MLTREEDIDVHALAKRGWTISAIARHLGRDRKTIRAYLNGDRIPGQRRSPGSAVFDQFEDYCRARLAEDPHLWAMTLFDELGDLDYGGSYPTLTRQIRERGLRPACEPCRPTKDRPVAVIEHRPGEETQWDWVELPNPPTSWQAGPRAHLLVGALAHSGKWRGILCESEDQPHLIDGLDQVTRALGGLTNCWRFDRMATVCHPGSGRVTNTFAAVAKHYEVQVAICPPRRGNRKGVVEKAVHIAAQRWWRNLPDDITIADAQARLDQWCQARGDARERSTPVGRRTVGVIAADEPLTPAPQLPAPAVLTDQRKVSAQALVAWRGNSYSVPPQLAGSHVTCRVKLGSGLLEITTPAATRPSGPLIVIAAHRLAPTGTGAMIRNTTHVTALNTAAMNAATSAPPHRSKTRIPPGPAARAAAAQLTNPNPSPPTGGEVIDLARYQRAATGRNTLK